MVKLINIVASEATSIQDAKPILEALTKDLAKFKNEDTIAICSAAIEALGPRKQFFIKEDALFRRGVVDVYDARDDFDNAIKVLKGISYDGDCYEEKIEDWLNLATYLFEIQDPSAAEPWVNKVMHIIHHT